jgi:hypothetical protein
VHRVCVIHKALAREPLSEINNGLVGIAMSPKSKRLPSLLVVS